MTVTQFVNNQSFSTLGFYYSRPLGLKQFQRSLAYHYRKGDCKTPLSNRHRISPSRNWERTNKWPRAASPRLRLLTRLAAEVDHTRLAFAHHETNLFVLASAIRTMIHYLWSLSLPTHHYHRHTAVKQPFSLGLATTARVPGWRRFFENLNKPLRFWRLCWRSKMNHLTMGFAEWLQEGRGVSTVEVGTLNGHPAAAARSCHRARGF